jgi:tetratricopeptide (TPR) repeat protein
LQAEGRLGEAEQALRQSLAIAEKLVNDLPSRADGLPALARVHSRLGELLWERGKQAESREHSRRARDAWERMASISPDSAESRRELSRLLADCPDPQMRDPARAAVLAREAVDKSPHMVAAWRTLGVALYRAGAANDAVAALGKSIDLKSGGDVTTWFFLALAYGQSGDRGQARSWHTKATEWSVKKRPKDPALLRLCAEAAVLLGLNDPPVVAKDPK